MAIWGDSVGEVLVDFLVIHLPTLIIIGGHLVLIDMYYKRIHNDEAIRVSLSEQIPIYRANQQSIEQGFIKIAFTATALIPTIALILFFTGWISHKLVFGVLHTALVLLLFLKVRKLNNSLKDLIDTANDLNTYPSNPFDPSTYYDS